MGRAGLAFFLIVLWFCLHIVNSVVAFSRG